MHQFCPTICVRSCCDSLLKLPPLPTPAVAGKPYLGAAHGMVGILHALLHCVDIIGQEDPQGVEDIRASLRQVPGLGKRFNKARRWRGVQLLTLTPQHCNVDTVYWQCATLHPLRPQPPPCPHCHDAAMCWRTSATPQAGPARVVTTPPR